MNIDHILQSYNSQKDETWLMNVMQLNLDCIEAVQMQKARSKLRKALWVKILAIVLGIIWVLFLGYLLYYSMTLSKIFFIISAGMIMLITAIAVIVYVQHVVLIIKIDNSDNVIDTQKRLAKLQTSTLQITRILFLQLPFYSSWFLTVNMLQNAGTAIFVMQVCITGGFALLAVWLYRNISLKNSQQKWFRILFSSVEWTAVVSAMELLKEIEAFRKEEQ